MADHRDILSRPAPMGVVDRYGDHPDQLIEWFRPTWAVHATVAVLHGGFWRAEYDRSHIRPLCHALAGEGYDVAAIEYRRTGDGGGCPSTFDDVATAVSVIAERLAGGGAPEPLALLGHSAGGQLALWAAAEAGDPTPPRSRRGRRLRRCRIAGVVALAAVSDLIACHRLDLDGGAVTDLLGGSPSDRAECYAEFDPAVRTPAGNPVLVHGDADRQVPVTMSRTFAADRGAEYHELAGMDHYGLIDPMSHAWPVVRRAAATATGVPAAPRS